MSAALSECDSCMTIAIARQPAMFRYGAAALHPRAPFVSRLRRGPASPGAIAGPCHTGCGTIAQQQAAAPIDPSRSISRLRERLEGTAMSDRQAPARRFRIEANPPVLYISAGLIAAILVFSVAFADAAGDAFTAAQAFAVAYFGWFYISAVAVFLVFVVFLAFTRFGNIRLGPDGSEPDYSYGSWFAMLFSAGMGIGIMFYGVAEPISHYVNPPVGSGSTVNAEREALMLTFFHWGLHAWAIYAVIAMSLAYFAFRRGLPLTIRSALYPLIGEKVHGPIGHTVDIFAVISTMFGLAASLGIGVLQVDAGLAWLFGAPVAAWFQVLLIIAITLCATASAVLGLDKGIKRLSEINIGLAVLLLVFVLATGPTVFLLQAFVQNVGTYLGNVIPRTFRMYAYEPNAWLGDWTLFYWGWWIAWSPFVGMFIARVSRGRTIREFISGVLLVPVAFTFLWMTVFGNTALWQEVNHIAPIAQLVKNDMPVALFSMLANLPLSYITTGIATLLVVTFFVTSADSGALVIDMLTSGGAENPPVWQRIFWAFTAGAVAAVLLLVGGLDALQTATIVSALPFTVVMLFICYGLYKALSSEPTLIAHAHNITDNHDLEEAIDALFVTPDANDAARRLHDVARPALAMVADRVRNRGASADFTTNAHEVVLRISREDDSQFEYRVQLKDGDGEIATGGKYLAASLSGESASHNVTTWTRRDIVRDVIANYARL
ncbi:BCCT family transporter [Stakelama saccharophila]|uniref:BCCT family transporter n=1 Tax=Stakelama saccharophila TaxID=3075605 RepID=A0ABZ0BET5_9SPHN|nr:BCCT family transporter [Stakelama sp. W311]WNO54939.1 BCCT family transporter [Stakelama sp. W311]